MPNRREREQIEHLFKLCYQGKVDLIEEFLSDFPRYLNVLDSRDMAMTSPLHVCSSVGHYHCVKLLLILNANQELVDMVGI